MTPRKLNTFTMLKLPSAWLCGVRVRHIDAQSCTVSVRHRWINQNPFNSMFWAVQGMAAELSTGVLVMAAIRKSGKRISMLVAHNQASFTKKARGRITFSCTDGNLIGDALQKTLETGEGQSFQMKSVGKDQQGDVVSVFTFEWTVRVKSER